MTSPDEVLLCPPEYVCTAFISSIGGFTADFVGPQRPVDDTTWSRNGAVTMFVVGGTDDPVFALSKTVFQVECWTCAPGSDEPPWLASWNLAAQIVMACKDRTNFSRPLHVSANGVNYPGANARSAFTLTTPRRVYGDRADFAGHIFDLCLIWAQESLLIR